MKKMLVVLLTSMLALTLVGCGGISPSESTGDLADGDEAASDAPANITEEEQAQDDATDQPASSQQASNDESGISTMPMEITLVVTNIQDGIAAIEINNQSGQDIEYAMSDFILEKFADAGWTDVVDLGVSEPEIQDADVEITIPDREVETCSYDMTNALDSLGDGDYRFLLNGLTAYFTVSGGVLVQESDEEDETAMETTNIPFEEGQLYAVAYLGYRDASALDYYVDAYLDGKTPETFAISDGDYYLVIPRYADMTVFLYSSDIETGSQAQIFESFNCEPFVIQCNESDVFSDATVRLDYDGKSVEFSPFVSGKDGSLDIGTAGLDVTRDAADGN